MPKTILKNVVIIRGRFGLYAAKAFIGKSFLFLNASMILGGMGPVNELWIESGKIFAGIYALYFGLIFLSQLV